MHLHMIGYNPTTTKTCRVESIEKFTHGIFRLKKRKLVKLKEQFFQQNGGLLLQQQIANYTVEELKNATNNFDECKILGKGDQGTVYKIVAEGEELSHPTQF
ncbi:hypothetical protein Ahy_A08g038166 isoform F [Arachis hypogaea]|uniref:Protein kinase domain-containing protein n=1 Tax=Arachis hypogaea TaxID=3818 RepID=A0A445BSU1_ARAHY|nr:hypothetical protein Ahy_A08g038166 isoform F [Arachis hypogaea]